MTKLSPSSGRMRASARKRRTHEFRQCVATRISGIITLWRDATHGRADSHAHTRLPKGRSERQRPSVAPHSSVPAIRWRSAKPAALRRTWPRSNSGRRVPRSRWSGDAGSARPAKPS